LLLADDEGSLRLIQSRVCRKAYFKSKLDAGKFKLGQKASELGHYRALGRQLVRQLGPLAFSSPTVRKSRMAGATAIYLALFQKHRLAPGEKGMVLVLAASVDQARVVFGYVHGFLKASPALAREVVAVKRFEIELRNGIVIAVHSNSYRTVRGRTLVGVVFDETAFWRDDTSATPDVETYTAVLPSLATTNGMLVGISTPYRKVGLLYQKHRDHFGVSDNDVLVVEGASKVFNPSLSDTVLAAQRAADPTGASAEWDALIRTDIGAFLDDELIEAAVDRGRPLELSPVDGVVYVAFIDASGGVGADAYTIGIGHKEGDSLVIDVVRGRSGKFNPQAVTKEYAALCKDYRITKVTGDAYGAEWVAGAWRGLGFEYIKSPQPKGALYLESLPAFTRGLARLPSQARLIRELRLLERRTHRSGKDVVEHPRNCRDDYANATCGVLSLLMAVPRVPEVPIVQPFVAGVPRYFPGSDEFTGRGAPVSSLAPAASYDYNREQSWKNYVLPDGSISMRPRGGWGFP
jgi:hypothetical protein